MKLYINNKILWCNIAFAIMFPLVTSTFVFAGEPDDIVKANDMRPSEVFEGTTSSETYSVNFGVKNHFLRIPRNYLETVASWGNTTFFRIVMTFPDFSGVNSRSEKLFSSLVSRAAWWDIAPPNVIWAYGVGHMSSAKLDWNDPILEAAKHQRDTNTEYGLKKVSGQSIVGDDYYIFDGKRAEDNVIIRCDPAPDGICYVDFDLAPGMVVEYAYKHSTLPRWREMDVGVKRVLRSFLEK